MFIYPTCFFIFFEHLHTVFVQTVETINFLDFFSQYTWLCHAERRIVCRELGKRLPKIGQSFPVVNFWETLIRHKSNNPLLHEESVFLQTVFPVSVALFLLHGLNIGLSTPTIRTFSSACPYPNSIHFWIDFRSHVFLEYVLAYISPPNHILNQCTMLCTEPTWEIHGLGIWGLWFASTSFALHRETGHPMHRMYLLVRLITPCSLF